MLYSWVPNTNIPIAEATILNNFYSAKGAEYQHGSRKGCLKGTRGAILEKIELWARDSGSSPVYWLNGLAGTGKSTIAQTIAERMFANGQLGASFFCSRDLKIGATFSQYSQPLPSSLPANTQTSGQLLSNWCNLIQGLLMSPCITRWRN